MEFWQRKVAGYTAPNDYIYVADMWRNIQDGDGAWDFEKYNMTAGAIPGLRHAIKLTNNTAFSQSI